MTRRAVGAAGHPLRAAADAAPMGAQSGRGLRRSAAAVLAALPASPAPPDRESEAVAIAADRGAHKISIGKTQAASKSYGSVNGAFGHAMPTDGVCPFMENFRLKVFRVVAGHLNFSRAAEELLLTQPAVTQQIKALEDEYGVSLFDRTGGRITLSPAGHVLLPYAEKLRAISAEAHAAVVGTAGKLAGQLALGASRTIGQYVLPNFVAEFLRENPLVSITAISGNTDTVLETLAAHRVDLAMVEGPALRKDVRMEPFMEDELVLVVPAAHAWAQREIELDDLRTAPLLMREFGSGSRRVVENALHHAGLKRKDLKIRMELDSTEGLISAVEAGLGVTFLSRWAVRSRLKVGTLKRARVRGLRLRRMFSVAYPTGPEPAGSAGAFRLLLLASSMKLRMAAAASSDQEQAPRTPSPKNSHR